MATILPKEEKLVQIRALVEELFLGARLATEAGMPKTAKELHRIAEEEKREWEALAGKPYD